MLIAPKRLKLLVWQAYSQGESGHDPLKIFRKGGVACDPPNFWALSANSSKTVKATDFKFDVHFPRDSPDMTPEKLVFCKNSLGGDMHSHECLPVIVARMSCPSCYPCFIFGRWLQVGQWWHSPSTLVSVSGTIHVWCQGQYASATRWQIICSCQSTDLEPFARGFQIRVLALWIHCVPTVNVSSDNWTRICSAEALALIDFFTSFLG